MLSAFECPYCVSFNNKLISSFYSAVLKAKTTVYQCEQCLSLFDSRDVEKQVLKKRLNELRQDAEERISIAAAPDIPIDAGDKSQTLVVVYGYDCLMNCVPVDSFWATPNNVQPSNLETEKPTSLDTVDSSVSHLLRLLFALFQIIFAFWVLCLAFGF